LNSRLSNLAIRALAPFNGQGAVRLMGPPCNLPERSCVPMVLALHELGTNAVKYGSLSTSDGIVEVRWQLRNAHGSGTAQELVLNWMEIGGPQVERPTRRGLGTKLVAQQTGIDTATMDFRPEGLVCDIVVKGAFLVANEGV
jgi:two-component sensor histidine kinase